MDKEDHNFENIFNSIKATAGTICFPVHHYHSTSRRFTGEGKGGGRIMVISTQIISPESMAPQEDTKLDAMRREWYTNNVGNNVKLEIKTFKIEDFDKYILSISKDSDLKETVGLKTANNSKAHSITLTKDSKIEYTSVNKQLSIVFHNIIKNNKKFVERDTFHLISDLRNDKAGTTLNNFFTITQLTQLAQLVVTICSSFVPDKHPIDGFDDFSSLGMFNYSHTKGLGYTDKRIILEAWQKTISMNEYIGIINAFFPNINKTISGGSEKPKVDWTDIVTSAVDKANSDKKALRDKFIKESTGQSVEPMVTNVNNILDQHKQDIKLGVDKYSSKFIYNNYFSVITHLYFYWLEYLNIAVVSGGIKKTPRWKKVSYGILCVALIGLAVTGVGLIGEVALGTTLISSVISTSTEILGLGLEAGAEVAVEAGTEVAVEAGTEVAVEAGTDVAVEAGTEVAVEAGTDVVSEVVTDSGLDVIKESVTPEELSNIQLSELKDLSGLEESDKQLIKQAQVIETKMEDEITENEKKIISTAKLLVLKKGINKVNKNSNKKGGHKKKKNRTKKLKINKNLRSKKIKRNKKTRNKE